MTNFEIVIAIMEGLISIALFYVGAKANKIDKLEDRLEIKAQEAVSAKFSVLAVEFKGAVSGLSQIVSQMEKRLERGEDEFDRHGESWHKMELKTQAEVGEVRQWAMETFGTKAELQSIHENLQHLQVKVARFEAMLRASA